MVRIVDAKERKAFLNRRFAENKDILKIGKEINRFKRIDGYRATPKEIERRFGKDANKFLERKPDTQLSKDIARDIIKGIRG